MAKPVNPEVAKAITQPDAAIKLALAVLLSELMTSGDFEIEFPDEFIAGKFAKRVDRLEARIAELEAAAKIKPKVERVDSAELASEPHSEVVPVPGAEVVKPSKKGKK